MKGRFNRLYLALLLIVVSVMVGVIGFTTIEEFSLNDAFYMTVITISTVGFNEVHTLSESGRLFTSFYIIFNIGIFAFAVSVITTYLFEGEVKDLLNKYVNNIGYKRMKDHVIVCGYGRNGQRASLELDRSKLPFIVIDSNPNVFKDETHMVKDMKYIIGDASNDEILKMAGIERAKAIISAMPKDATNVFVTLTARGLNPKIKIIARASEASSETKLIRAGADNVIMPDAIGGHHMASLVTKPAVIEFVELLNGVGSDTTVMLEEIGFDVFKPEYKGHSIKELDIRRKSGVTIIGLKDRHNKFIFNPSLDTPIAEGYILIALGKEEELEKFRTEFLMA